MAWTLPTAAEVKAAIAALADVADDDVNASLALAEVEVLGTLPNQVVYTRAVQLYVAHDLTLRGLGTSPEADMAQTGSLQSVSDGAVSFSRAQGAGDDPMKLTTYGARYKQLIERYLTPFAVFHEENDT